MSPRLKSICHSQVRSALSSKQRGDGWLRRRGWGLAHGVQADVADGMVLSAGWLLHGCGQWAFVFGSSTKTIFFRARCMSLPSLHCCVSEEPREVPRGRFFAPLPTPIRQFEPKGRTSILRISAKMHSPK